MWDVGCELECGYGMWDVGWDVCVDMDVGVNGDVNVGVDVDEMFRCRC